MKLHETLLLSTPTKVNVTLLAFEEGLECLSTPILILNEITIATHTLIAMAMHKLVAIRRAKVDLVLVRPQRRKHSTRIVGLFYLTPLGA